MKSIEERVQELENSKKGITKEITVVNSYVRLFTLINKAEWKGNTVLFKLDDTQNNQFSFLANLIVYKGNTPTLTVNSFEIIDFKGASFLSNLVAVSVGNYKVEVYYKMSAQQSPTLSILNISKYMEIYGYGEIEKDCQTVVSALPTGTQTVAMIAKLETVEDWKTLTNREGFCYRKVGNDIEVSIIIDNMNLALNNGAFVNLGYMPQGYRPRVKGITIPCIVYPTGSTLITGQISINTNGEIVIRQLSGQNITANQARGFVKYSIL